MPFMKKKSGISSCALGPIKKWEQMVSKVLIYSEIFFQKRLGTFRF